jgi:excisionase family DNA binding protein
MSEEPRLWLTVVEAAKQTGYHRAHVQELACEGKIKAELTTAGDLIYMPIGKAFGRQCQVSRVGYPARLVSMSPGASADSARNGSILARCFL